MCVCELNARLCKGRAVYTDTLLCFCLCFFFFFFIAVVVSVAIVVVAVVGGIVFCCCVSCRLNDNIVAILFAHNLLLFLEWVVQDKGREGEGAKETLPTGRKRTNFSGRKH